MKSPSDNILPVWGLKEKFRYNQLLKLPPELLIITAIQYFPVSKQCCILGSLTGKGIPLVYLPSSIWNGSSSSFSSYFIIIKTLYWKVLSWLIVIHTSFRTCEYVFLSRFALDIVKRTKSKFGYRPNHAFKHRFLIWGPWMTSEGHGEHSEIECKLSHIHIFSGESLGSTDSLQEFPESKKLGATVWKVLLTQFFSTNDGVTFWWTCHESKLHLTHLTYWMS